MMASKGTCNEGVRSSVVVEGLEASPVVVVVVGGGGGEAVGLVKSVRDAEERRSVTAEEADAGMLDAWCCEAA